MKFGAIDIGTNAVRLLIGEVIQITGIITVKKVSYVRVPLRLGMEVFEDGLISESKTVDFIKTIQAFQLLSDVYQVKELRACATSAMREAKNGKAIQKLILEETDVNIEIIDGELEAQLIYANFLGNESEKYKASVIVDVGGGSTEISIFQKGKREASKSFKLGTIRFLKKKIDERVWGEIRQWIIENIDDQEDYETFATGGNINRLHKILNKKPHESIPISALKEIRQKLESISIDERIKEYGLKEDRADVIVPACEIYLHVFECLKSHEVFVPKIGLADGIIRDLASNYHG